MTGIRECGEAGNSASVRLNSGMHEIQMIGYDAKIADEKRMSVKTSYRLMMLQEASGIWRATAVCSALKVKVASLNCMRRSSGSQ